MAKKKKASKTTLKRPTTSPYSGPQSTLRFGPDQKAYYVPKVLLQSLEELSIDDPWGIASSTISLPDVDADSGHVMVHFLHTGTYQTLADDGEDITPSLTASKEFLKAALVFVATKKYKLPGLEELARKEMERCGTDVHLTELVQLISDDTFEVLCSDSSLLQDFVTDKVEVAIKSSDDTFMTTGFFASIASSTLARFLAQEVVNIYHKENAELRNKTAAPNGHPSAMAASPKTSLEAGSRPPAEEHVIPAEPCSEPVLEDRGNDHPLYDWGFDSMTTKKKKKRMKKPTVPEPDKIIVSLREPVPEPDLEPVPEALPILEPLLEESVAVPEESAAVPEESAAVLEESVAIPDVIHAEPDCDPFAGLSKSQRKKLQKKMEEEEKIAKEETARVAGATNEAVHEFDPLEAPLPPAPPATEPECIFDNPPLAESTLVMAEDQWWDDFGPSKKKKKKEEEGAGCSVDTLTKQEAAMGSGLIEDILLVNHTEVPDPTVELAAAHNAKECPWRAEHLSETDGWRTCAPCELYVRKIASKLYPVGYPNANEVSTVK